MSNTDWTPQKTFEPKVDATREFLEIATDFANPLDIVREAISNAYDAKCSYIRIHFEVKKKAGEHILRIYIEDDGEGMDEEELKSFFNLGSSLRRDQKETDVFLIGEKGHGTKIYFNSDLVEVTTTKGIIVYHARMEHPYTHLHDNKIPPVEIREKPNLERLKGTRIEILGYNRNRRELFNHDRLKDHIIWFTKHGSVEKEFEIIGNQNIALYLKGIDRTEEEQITFGHVFPQPSESVEKLFDKYSANAPDYYCNRWKNTGYLPDFPDIQYQSIFYLEGDRIKRESNPMLSRRGPYRKEGIYQVQERYGLWICKDYIPVQRKNEWITSKGREFTKFHAFVNCQALRLTANRGSIENTPAEILANLERAVRIIFEEITDSDDWGNLEYLEQSAFAYQTEEKEKKDYERRIKKIKAIKVANHKGVTLTQPRQENGVYALVVALQTVEPNLFPFEIVDYDTHNGIDVLAKTRDNVDVGKSNLKYVEFKHTLTEAFNHSFRYLHSIVCWQSQVQHDQVVEDISGNKRTLRISPKKEEGDHTRYMLDDPRDPHKIQIFVLEEYLKEKLDIAFSTRVETSDPK